MSRQGAEKTIFLSHASEDQELAAMLQAAIEDAFPGAFRIFNAFQRDSIAPSDEWRTKLRNAVSDSSLLLVLLTRNSLGKPWIYWECGGAYHRGIPIIPLLGPGCGTSSLPDPFREIQAVSIQNESGLRRLMDRLAQEAGMKYLPYGYDLSLVAERLNDIQIQYRGKQWSDMTDDALRRFLFNDSDDPVLEIRVISYTSETMARTIPKRINELSSTTTKLRMKILVRSEYDRFASRPKDADFNKLIRWRISRAKADWYRWVRDLRGRTGSIELEIRDYGWDPALRAFLLGRREGFVGLYAMKFQTPSGHHQTPIPPAMDWVAADTVMARIESSSQELLNNLVEWFDHVWEKGTTRTNEAYRCQVSNLLLKLAENKSAYEAAVRSATSKWRSTRGAGSEGWEIGNLALPASYPEQIGNVIDFMACAVVFRDIDETVLVCEIRQPGETWEGIGKTSTYLDLLGIEPEASYQDQKLQCDSLSDLHDLVRDGADIRWNDKQRDRRVSLFATDFVWLHQQHGMIQVIQPEGEVLWGLWDCARHLLRMSLSDRDRFAGVQRSETGRSIQKELFVKLPIAELARCYVGNREAHLSAIVVLCPDTCEEARFDEVKNPHAAQRLLIEAIQSAPHHPSQFWRRTDSEVQRHNDLAARIVNGLDVDLLPKMYTIRRRVPFGSVGALIWDEIYPRLQ